MKSDINLKFILFGILILYIPIQFFIMHITPMLMLLLKKDEILGVSRERLKNVNKIYSWIPSKEQIVCALVVTIVLGFLIFIYFR
ncbi:MAG: hypothetical protein ABIH18_08455 [Candidatus Omnitrophota bacterium]